MKNSIYKITGCLLCLALLVGCKDDGGEAKVSFPQMQELSLASGTQGTLTFEAPADHWELISEQPVWCRLSYGDQQNMPSVLGGSGTVTVNVSVTNDMAEFLFDSRCELTLVVGGEEKCIATIVRKALEFSFSLSMEDTLLEPESILQLNHAGEATLHVEANFGDLVVIHSDWLEVTGDGAGNYALSLAEGYSTKYPLFDGFITFEPANITDISYRYPVQFPGMNPETVIITGYQYQSDAQSPVYTIPAYGWEVSGDGQVFTYVRANGDVVEVENALPLCVDALNDQLVFATFADNHFTKCDGREFFHIAQLQSQLTLTVDALPTGVRQRSASIFVFTPVAWEKLPQSAVEEEQYASNALFSFSQQESSSGFEVKYNDKSQNQIVRLDVGTCDDASLRSQVLQLIPSVPSNAIFITHTASVQANSLGNKAITVGALYGAEEWNIGTTEMNCALVDLATGNDMSYASGYTLEVGFSSDSKWQFDLGFPSQITEPLLFVMYDPNDRTQVLKVLLIDNKQ